MREGRYIALLLALVLSLAPAGSLFAAERGDNAEIPSVRVGGQTEGVASECGEAGGSGAEGSPGCPSTDRSAPPHSSGKADTVLPTPSDPGFDYGGFCSILGSFNNACLMLLDCAGANGDRPCPVTDCAEAIAAGGQGRTASSYTVQYDERCNLPAGCSRGDTSGCDPCPSGYYERNGIDDRCNPDSMVEADWCDENNNFTRETDPSYVIMAACAELCTIDPTHGICAIMQCVMNPGPKCCAIIPVAECCELFDLAQEILECIDQPSPECCEILANPTVNKVQKIPPKLVETCTEIWMCTESMIYFDKWNLTKKWDSTKKKNFMIGAGSDGNGAPWPVYDENGTPTGANKQYSGLQQCCRIHDGFQKTCEGVLCLVGDYTDPNQTGLNAACPSAECCGKFPENPFCAFCRCQEAVDKGKFQESAQLCCPLIDVVAGASDKVGAKMPDTTVQKLKDVCALFFECFAAADSLINGGSGCSGPCYWSNKQHTACQCAKQGGGTMGCPSCKSAVEQGQTPPGNPNSWYTDTQQAINATAQCCQATVNTAGGASSGSAPPDPNAGPQNDVLTYGSMACSLARCFANPSVVCCTAVPRNIWKKLKDETGLDCPFIFQCMIDPFLSNNPSSPINTSFSTPTLNDISTYTNQCCDGLVNSMGMVFPDVASVNKQMPVCAGIKCLIDSIRRYQAGDSAAPFNMKCCDAIPPSINKEIGDLCPTVVACVRNTTLVCCDRVRDLFRAPPYSDWFCAGNPGGDWSSPGCAVAAVNALIPRCSEIAACVQQVEQLSQGLLDANGNFTQASMNTIVNMDDRCCSIADRLIDEMQLYTYQQRDAYGNPVFNPDGSPMMVEARFSLCELKRVLKCMMRPTPQCCSTVTTFLRGLGLVLAFPLPNNESITTDEFVQLCEMLMRCFQQPGPACCALFGVVDIVGAANVSAIDPLYGPIVSKLDMFSPGAATGGGLERTCRNMWQCIKEPTPGCCAQFPKITKLAQDYFCTNPAFQATGLDGICKCAARQCTQLIECGLKVASGGKASGTGTVDILPPLCCSALANLTSCCEEMASSMASDAVCSFVKFTNKVAQLGVCNPPPARKKEMSCYDPSSGFKGCECQAPNGIDDLIDDVVILPPAPPPSVPVPPTPPIDTSPEINPPLPPVIPVQPVPTPPPGDGSASGVSSSSSGVSSGSSSGVTSTFYPECWQGIGGVDSDLYLCRECTFINGVLASECDYLDNGLPPSNPAASHLQIACNEPQNAQRIGCVDATLFPTIEDTDDLRGIPAAYRGTTLCLPMTWRDNGGNTGFISSYCVEIPGVQPIQPRTVPVCWEVTPQPNGMKTLKYHLNCVIDDIAGTLVSFDDSSITPTMTARGLTCSSQDSYEWLGCRLATPGVSTAFIPDTLIDQRICAPGIITELQGTTPVTDITDAFCVDFRTAAPYTSPVCWQRSLLPPASVDLSQPATSTAWGLQLGSNCIINPSDGLILQAYGPGQRNTRCLKRCTKTATGWTNCQLDPGCTERDLIGLDFQTTGTICAPIGSQACLISTGQPCSIAAMQCDTSNARPCYPGIFQEDFCVTMPAGDCWVHGADTVTNGNTNNLMSLWHDCVFDPNTNKLISGQPDGVTAMCTRCTKSATGWLSCARDTDCSDGSSTGFQYLGVSDTSLSNTRLCLPMVSGNNSTGAQIWPNEYMPLVTNSQFCVDIPDVSGATVPIPNTLPDCYRVDDGGPGEPRRVRIFQNCDLNPNTGQLMSVDVIGARTTYYADCTSADTAGTGGIDCMSDVDPAVDCIPASKVTCKLLSSASDPGMDTQLILPSTAYSTLSQGAELCLPASVGPGSTGSYWPNYCIQIPPPTVLTYPVCWHLTGGYCGSQGWKGLILRTNCVADPVTGAVTANGEPWSKCNPLPNQRHVTCTEAYDRASVESSFGAGKRWTNCQFTDKSNEVAYVIGVSDLPTATYRWGQTICAPITRNPITNNPPGWISGSVVGLPPQSEWFCAELPPLRTPIQENYCWKISTDTWCHNCAGLSWGAHTAEACLNGGTGSHNCSANPHTDNCGGVNSSTCRVAGRDVAILHQNCQLTADGNFSSVSTNKARIITEGVWVKNCDAGTWLNCNEVSFSATSPVKGIWVPAGLDNGRRCYYTAEQIAGATNGLPPAGQKLCVDVPNYQ